MRKIRLLRLVQPSISSPRSPRKVMPPITRWTFRTWRPSPSNGYSRKPVHAEGRHLAAFGVVTSLLCLCLCLGLACDEGEADRSFECASLERVAHIAHAHYEGVDCETAIRSAESRLSAAYYRKACEQRSPAQGVPDAVSDAYVSACAPGNEEQGGSILQIEVCCP